MVLSDLSFPVFATAVPGYVGVFGNSATPEEARTKAQLWLPKPADATAPDDVGPKAN